MKRSVLCFPDDRAIHGRSTSRFTAADRCIDHANSAGKMGLKRIPFTAACPAPAASGEDEQAEAKNSSDVEADVDDVAVLHQVVASLDSHLPLLAGTNLTAAVDEVLIRDHFGTNEPFHEVGVDLP